jgi:glycosyltransferase involved in cell wall biosynthesis
LGLDFALDSVYWQHRQLVSLKKRGVKFWFVMYDLLPVQRPDWFSDKLVVRYRRWLRIVSGLADGFFCISPSVADDLRSHLRDQYRVEEAMMPRFSVMPMGWDIQHSRHSDGVSEYIRRLCERLRESPTALMVGTLEPRKGHADVFAAFDRLWRAGAAYNLVIVGRPGWKTESLQRAIREHPGIESRLFWIEDATDEEVECLYDACWGLIVASYGEGFGLPVIEALGHRRPVLVREIPVFQPRMSGLVEYFPVRASAEQLSAAIADWLPNARSGEEVQSIALPSWLDAANHVLSAIADSR